MEEYVVGPEELYHEVLEEGSLDPETRVKAVYAHEIAEEEGHDEFQQMLEDKEFGEGKSRSVLRELAYSFSAGLAADYGFRIGTGGADPVGEAGVAFSQYLPEIGGMAPEVGNVTGTLIFIITYGGVQLYQLGQRGASGVGVEEMREGLSPDDLPALSDEHMEILEELEKEYGVDMYPEP